MSEAFRSIRFRCTFFGERVEGPVVNPGGRHGNVWLIEIPDGPLLAVEADDESDAIHILSNDKEYGHWLSLTKEQVKEQKQVRVYPKTLGLIYMVSWAPSFYQKTQMIHSSIELHDAECLI